MSTRILTLFGEEEVPDMKKPEPKARAKKEAEEATEADVPAPPPQEEAVPAAVTKQGDTVTPEEKPAPPKSEAAPAAEITTTEATTKTETPGKVKVVKARTPKVAEDIIPEDWQGNKTYYTIGEVADFFKVKTSHIRFWTNEFKLKVRTTRKGDRLYTPEQVKELRAIYHLVKERGFTLSGAKAKLKTQNNRDVATVDLKTSLLQLKNKLIKLRNQLV